jgi:hypothetical protein
VPDSGIGDIATTASTAAALLLIVAAAAKLRAPGPTADLLGRLNLPAPRPAVPLIAVAEIVIAGLSLRGGVAILPLALAYLVFAGVALRLLLSAPGASCGCFGAAQTPVTAVHVLITVGFAAAGVLAMFSAPGYTLWHGYTGVVLSAQVVLLGGLTYATLAIYPQLVAAGKVSS